MKKLIIATTFVTFGLVTAGAGAAITLKGSDTIKDLTLALIPTCAGAAGNITYIGGGSGGGETAMATSAQQTAPMSRFIQNNAAVCGFGTDSSEAEGIAFAADGLSVFASQVHQTACDPGSIGASSCAPVAATGLKHSGTLPTTGYAFADWKNVLRVLYFGLDTNAANPAISARQCSSAIRQELVNGWGNLFENNCAPGSSLCSAGLRHAFRRDENSGTTDVFRELLKVNAGSATGNNGFPFCNEYTPAATLDPAPLCPPTGVSNLVTVGNGAAPAPNGPGLPLRPYYELFQDADPIRRTTIGTGNLPFTAGGSPNTNATEQVSSVRGDLGVVLPISPPQSVADADRYPTTYCSLGLTTRAAAPLVASLYTCTSTAGLAGPAYALCPNGDMPVGAQWCSAAGLAVGGIGQCLFPTSVSGDPRCINGKNNNITLFNPPPVPACVVATASGDGRVYNLHPHKQDGTYVTQTYSVNDSSLPGATSVPIGSASRQVVGAFYRIHTTRTAHVATNATCAGENCCKKDSDTDQIGCLVEANPCSIGFAGRGADQIQLAATSGTLTNFATSQNGVQPLDGCLETEQYPLARLLFDNTLLGFRTSGGVTDPELSLAKCFSDNSAATRALISSFNFVPLVSGPHCQDFHNADCGDPAEDATHPSACANNPAGIAP